MQPAAAAAMRWTAREKQIAKNTSKELRARSLVHLYSANWYQWWNDVFKLVLLLCSTLTAALLGFGNTRSTSAPAYVISLALSTISAMVSGFQEVRRFHQNAVDHRNTSNEAHVLFIEIDNMLARSAATREPAPSFLSRIAEKHSAIFINGPSVRKGDMEKFPGLLAYDKTKKTRIQGAFDDMPSSESTPPSVVVDIDADVDVDDSAMLAAPAPRRASRQQQHQQLEMARMTARAPSTRFEAFADPEPFLPILSESEESGGRRQRQRYAKQQEDAASTHALRMLRDEDEENEDEEYQTADDEPPLFPPAMGDGGEGGGGGGSGGTPRRARRRPSSQ